MVTMNDIAARVGVSQATVSYVLNERSNGIRIREETRQRIQETAIEMGYRRNDLARAMVTGKNFVFGFLTRNPSAEGSSRIMVGAHEEANSHGYMLNLLPLSNDCDAREVIHRCMEQRLAGILAQNLSSAVLEQLETEATRFNVPVALLDDPPPQKWGTRVVSDDDQGLRDGLDHLMALGHTRIGFISAQAKSALAAGREASFRGAMAARGLTVTDGHIINTDWQETRVIEPRVTALLQSGARRPTALMCAGDTIAMTTQRAARAIGLVLPRDLSVIGFADFLMASYADPPLTTIAQAFEEIGRSAVKQLLVQVAAPKAAGDLPANPQGGATITLPTRLVIRASTAPPQ